MFPFGSFISQIPLILIASVYLLYCAAFAINKTSERSRETSLTEREAVSHFYPQTTPANVDIFRLVSCDTHETLYDKPEETPLFRSYFILPVRHASPGTGISLLRYSIFSRPPPLSD